MRARCSQNQPHFSDFSGPDMEDGGLWLIWHQFSKAHSGVPVECLGCQSSPGPSLCRSLAAKLLSSPSVLGAALASVSRKQHRLKVLHAEGFSPKPHFTHNNDNKAYGLQQATNSGQPTTSDILLLSTLSIQAVLAGATHLAVALCVI